jgi:hypothetical protein
VKGKLVRELRRRDVVLMVLLAREEKGWNFGLTRNRMAAGSEIAGAAGGGRRAVLVEHEIGEEERRRRLTVVDRGAPAR